MKVGFFPCEQNTLREKDMKMRSNSCRVDSRWRHISFPISRSREVASKMSYSSLGRSVVALLCLLSLCPGCWRVLLYSIPCCSHHPCPSPRVCTSAAATTLIHHSGISSQEWTPYWPSDFFFYWCFVCLLALELIAPHLVIAQLDYPKENINKALLFDHDPYLFIVDPKTGEQGELLGAAQ